MTRKEKQTMSEGRPAARRLRDLVEPVAAGLYFAPEAIGAFEELGLNYFEGYFCSRSACMGRVPGSVVTAAFGHFAPDVVERAIESGSTKADLDAVLAARQRGAEAQLERLIGAVIDVERVTGPVVDIERATEILRSLTDGLNPAGRALFAGLTALPWPGTPYGDLWRAADLVREHRGDAHIAAWMGLADACEITLMTELYWGMPARSYVYTRGWSAEEIAAAAARLADRGILRDDQLTPEGRDLREEIEQRTDASEAEIMARLGDRKDELFGLLRPMAKAIVDGGGYPVDPSRMGDTMAASTRTR
jgi:hypothetical protein